MFGRAAKKHRILILGPPSSGKTTIMYRLAQQPVPESMVPTAANVLEKRIDTEDGHRFVFAEQKIESLGASAIIFVVELDNVENGIASIKQFLNSMAQRDIPLLILVNKQDRSEQDHLNEVCAEITPLVGVDRSWAVWGCSGTANTGLLEAKEWLETKLPIS